MIMLKIFKDYIGKFLCCIGCHRWKYVTDNKIFPFINYKVCKRCGRIKI